MLWGLLPDGRSGKLCGRGYHYVDGLSDTSVCVYVSYGQEKDTCGPFCCSHYSVQEFASGGCPVSIPDSVLRMLSIVPRLNVVMVKDAGFTFLSLSRKWRYCWAFLFSMVVLMDHFRSLAICCPRNMVLLTL